MTLKYPWIYPWISISTTTLDIFYTRGVIASGARRRDTNAGSLKQWRVTMRINPIKPTVAIWVHPVPDRVKPSFVIFDTGTLTLSPERQSARMSKTTNDGLSRSCTGCFIVVPIWQQWVKTGQKRKEQLNSCSTDQ